MNPATKNNSPSPLQFDLQTQGLLDIVDRFGHLRVLVIGEAILDGYLQGQSARLCREDPAPVVAIAQTQNVPGGAANTAANAAVLGAQVHFLSVTGCDRASQTLKTVLQQRGVKTASLIADPTRTTLAKRRVLSGDRLLVRFDEGSTHPIAGNTLNRFIEQLKHHFPLSDAIIISDYAYGIITPQILSVLQQLQTQHPRVLVADAKQLETYASVGLTAVKPNYDETRKLLNLPAKSGQQRLEQIFQHGPKVLKKAGAQMAAITLDTDGTLTFLQQNSPIRTYAKPAPNSHAVGAGDTYVAVLALALAAGANPSRASTLAATATAITTTEPGTTCCEPTALKRKLARAQKRIANSTELAATVRQHRTLNQRIVFTNGCFDILHSGHVTCLEQARSLGDILIVGVNSDESIRQLKGETRPVNCLADRMTVLAALGCVSYVVPFGDLSPRELIRQIRPDIYTKGGDYSRQTLPETPLIEELGGEVIILPYLNNRSTTQLIEKIQTHPERS